MPKFIDNILKVINRIFRNQNMIEPSQSEKFLQKVLNAGVIKDYTEGLERNLDLQKMDDNYEKKLGNGCATKEYLCGINTMIFTIV